MSTGGMSWGHGEEHWRRDGSERMVGQPPPPGMFRGRAGVLVEVTPNQFVSWQMHGSFGEVEIEREEVHGFDPPALVYVPGLTVVRFRMEGILGALDDHAPRPDWATEPAGEIEARRALEGR